MTERSVATEPPPSTRVVLARLAAAVLAAEPAVEPAAGRGRWVTFDGVERIDGVVAAVGSDEKVEIELHLIARWTSEPLPRLADRLRASVRSAAREAGLGSRLGEISVGIHDIDLGDAAGSLR